MSWQTNTDGILFEGDDPKHPSHQQRLDILDKSLNSMGWTTQINQHPPQGKFIKFTGEVEKTGQKLTLEIYIFPNLAYASRETRPFEKRIQLTRPFEEHSSDFKLSKTGEHRCLLLGLYLGSENEAIICAWDTNAYLEHANPTSCYVDVRAISEAYRIGFGRSEDSKKRYVCCFRPEFIHYYLANMENLHTPPQKIIENQENEQIEAIHGGENKIFYGAPGTGKTYRVDEIVGNSYCIRTVFHPDLQNNDFIGALKPVTHEGKVTYEFSPGPFALALKESIMFPNKKIFLVIEELNRAPAAAVFADIFLLLDRDETGRGRYDVNFPNDEFKFWLNDQCACEIEKLRLPSNLWLFATMNSADQGVFPLDTAFRRRWNQEYINIDYTHAPKGNFNIVMADGTPQIISWANFSRSLNNYLSEHLFISEDRLLGPWFVSEAEISANNLIPGKILIYLWDDLLRHHGRELIFNTNTIKTYGTLSNYVAQEKTIFTEGFLKFIENISQDVINDA